MVRHKWQDTIDVPIVICRICRIPKLPSQLRKPNANGVLQKICRVCASKEAQRWGKDNPSKQRISDRNYRLRHRDRILKRQKVRYLENRNHYLEYHRGLLRKYPWRYKASSHKRNRSKSDVFKKLMKEQNGLCAICQMPPNGEELHMDHDHTTGEWRGLLCAHCNKAVGCFVDDPELLRRAIKYLGGS